jgi:hypothetical protein
MTSTATITAADTLLLATRLAGSDAGPLDRGAPSLLGGTKYFVGFGDIPTDQRGHAILAAAGAVGSLANDGSISLAIATTDPNRLKDLKRVNLNLGTLSAAGVVENLNGRLAVHRQQAGGGSSSRPTWVLTLGQSASTPAGYTQLTFMGMGELPDPLQRKGFAAAVLDAIGFGGGELVAEFNPMARIDGGPPLCLSQLLLVWAKPGPGLSFSDLPDVVNVGGKQLKLFVDGESRRDRQAGAAPAARGTAAAATATAAAAAAAATTTAAQAAARPAVAAATVACDATQPQRKVRKALKKRRLANLAAREAAGADAAAAEAAETAAAAVAAAEAAAVEAAAQSAAAADAATDPPAQPQRGVRKAAAKNKRQRANKRARRLEERARHDAAVAEVAAFDAAAATAAGPPDPAAAAGIAAASAAADAATHADAADTAAAAGAAAATAAVDAAAAMAEAADAAVAAAAATAAAEAVAAARVAPHAATPTPPPADPSGAPPLVNPPMETPSAAPMDVDDPTPSAGAMSSGAIAQAEQEMALDLNLGHIPPGNLSPISHAALVRQVNLDRGYIEEREGTASCDGDAGGSGGGGGNAAAAAAAGEPDSGDEGSSSSPGRSFVTAATSPPHKRQATRQAAGGASQPSEPRTATPPPAPTAGAPSPSAPPRGALYTVPALRNLPHRQARDNGPPMPQEQYASNGRRAREQRLGREAPAI